MLGKWGVQAASRGHFSENGCVAVTSQVAEGQGISCIPLSVIRYNVVYQTAKDKPNGSSVESGPGYLGQMSVCVAAQWFKLSESWPKFQFFDLHKMLKNLFDG